MGGERNAGGRDPYLLCGGHGCWVAGGAWVSAELGVNLQEVRTLWLAKS